VEHNFLLVKYIITRSSERIQRRFEVILTSLSTLKNNGCCVLIYGPNVSETSLYFFADFYY